MVDAMLRSFVPAILQETTSSIVLNLGPARVRLAYCQDSIVNLSDFRVERERRREGHAGRLLKRVTDWADREGITIILDAAPDDPKMRREDLERFYLVHGFVPVGARERFFTSMERLPRATIIFED